MSSLQMTLSNAEEDEEADVLVDRRDTTTTRYNMEIGPRQDTTDDIMPEILICGFRLYYGKKIIMHSNCILDSIANLLVRHRVFVGNVQKSPITPHLIGLDLLLISAVKVQLTQA